MPSHGSGGGYDGPSPTRWASPRLIVFGAVEPHTRLRAISTRDGASADAANPAQDAPSVEEQEHGLRLLLPRRQQHPASTDSINQLQAVSLWEAQRRQLPVLHASERRVSRVGPIGMSNRQIAEALFATLSRVPGSLGDAWRKLAVNVRACCLRRSLQARRDERLTRQSRWRGAPVGEPGAASSSSASGRPSSTSWPRCRQSP
jgi:hypothetical protein